MEAGEQARAALLLFESLELQRSLTPTSADLIAFIASMLFWNLVVIREFPLAPSNPSFSTRRESHRLG
jgi:hypothetical protein